MTDREFDKLLQEAISAAEAYPYFDALAAAEGSEIWNCLFDQQREIVKKSLPCGESGITSHSGCEIEGSNPSGAGLSE